MPMQQTLVFGVLALALVFFVWGRWRYDLVALVSLLVLVVAGVVPGEEAFLGFGHPAVVTVAAVLVISRGLANAGLVAVVTGWLRVVGDRITLQVGALTALVAISSGFINNVGALALFMPVAIRVAREHQRPASIYLMPIAAGSLLGGLTTLIGTPPNIVIASFRADLPGGGFGMFDFLPVGAGVAVAGVLLITVVGWRLIPRRVGEEGPEVLFEMDEYVTELRIPRGSRWAGSSIGELGHDTEGRLTVIGIVRGEEEIASPGARHPLVADDTLVVEIAPDDLDDVLEPGELELAGARELRGRLLESTDVRIVEAVVLPQGILAGRTPRGIRLRSRFGVNLLGVARRGSRVRGRLADMVLRPGDVLLLQGREEALEEGFERLGAVPAVVSDEGPGRRPRRVVQAAAVFGVFVALSVFGLLAIHIALTGAAVVMVLMGLVRLRNAYQTIEWPVIILLGAMIPLGDAMERTGGADTVAALLLAPGDAWPVWASVAALLVGSMLLSNVINNVAAAVLLAPVGLAMARSLDISADPMLMAVAIGASCAFMTPIGHQSNTLVLGPGGYRFGDYLYLGIPLSLLAAAVGVPLILAVWPP
jgi:di/tricarboxylate transporter